MSGALIAMSGGVDSSVAAFLTVEQGLDCIGSMMKLFSNEDIGEDCRKNCCSLADAEDARAVAYKLGIPFYVFNYTDAFKKHVISAFVEAYQNGKTPNPCIDCNRHLKFEHLLRRAMELEKDYIVTGHYSQIEYDSGSGRYLLKKGIDSSKDQSYVLYSMTQRQLSHTLFPLGGFYKTQVREIALQNGFVNANKHDSQDICFVRNGVYADFIEEYTGCQSTKGRFTDTYGNDLGEHKGIMHYTIGQRKGLGITAPKPYYVCDISPKDNRVVVGSEKELFSRTLYAKDINFIPFDSLDGSLKVTAKLRYKQPEQPAALRQIDSDTFMVEFEHPQRAITKGQAVVLYDGDMVIGGGTITGAEYDKFD